MPAGTNAITEPVTAKVIVFKSRSGPLDAAVNPLLKINTISGSGASVGLDGTAGTEMLPWSRDYSILATREIKICMLPYTKNVGTGYVAENTSPNGHIPCFGKCHIDLSKHLPAKLTYRNPSDGTVASTIPDNFWLSVGVYFVASDGQAKPVADIPLKMYSFANLYFSG